MQVPPSDPNSPPTTGRRGRSDAEKKQALLERSLVQKELNIVQKLSSVDYQKSKTNLKALGKNTLENIRALKAYKVEFIGLQNLIGRSKQKFEGLAKHLEVTGIKFKLPLSVIQSYAKAESFAGRVNKELIKQKGILDSLSLAERMNAIARKEKIQQTNQASIKERQLQADYQREIKAATKKAVTADEKIRSDTAKQEKKDAAQKISRSTRVANAEISLSNKIYDVERSRRDLPDNMQDASVGQLRKLKKGWEDLRASLIKKQAFLPELHMPEKGKVTGDLWASVKDAKAELQRRADLKQVGSITKIAHLEDNLQEKLASRQAQLDYSTLKKREHVADQLARNRGGIERDESGNAMFGRLVGGISSVFFGNKLTHHFRPFMDILKMQRQATQGRVGSGGDIGDLAQRTERDIQFAQSQYNSKQLQAWKKIHGGNLEGQIGFNRNQGPQQGPIILGPESVVSFDDRVARTKLFIEQQKKHRAEGFASLTNDEFEAYKNELDFHEAEFAKLDAIWSKTGPMSHLFHGILGNPKQLNEAGVTPEGLAAFESIYGGKDRANIMINRFPKYYKALRESYEGGGGNGQPPDGGGGEGRAIEEGGTAGAVAIGGPIALAGAGAIAVVGLGIEAYKHLSALPAEVLNSLEPLAKAGRIAGVNMSDLAKVYADSVDEGWEKVSDKYARLGIINPKQAAEMFSAYGRVGGQTQAFNESAIAGASNLLGALSAADWMEIRGKYASIGIPGMESGGARGGLSSFMKMMIDAVAKGTEAGLSTTEVVDALNKTTSVIASTGGMMTPQQIAGWVTPGLQTGMSTLRSGSAQAQALADSTAMSMNMLNNPAVFGMFSGEFKKITGHDPMKAVSGSDMAKVIKQLTGYQLGPEQIADITGRHESLTTLSQTLVPRYGIPGTIPYTLLKKYMPRSLFGFAATPSMISMEAAESGAAPKDEIDRRLHAISYYETASSKGYATLSDPGSSARGYFHMIAATRKGIGMPESIVGKSYEAELPYARKLFQHYLDIYGGDYNKATAAWQAGEVSMKAHGNVVGHWSPVPGASPEDVYVSGVGNAEMKLYGGSGGGSGIVNAGALSDFDETMKEFTAAGGKIQKDEYKLYRTRVQETGVEALPLIKANLELDKFGGILTDVNTALIQFLNNLRGPDKAASAGDAHAPIPPIPHGPGRFEDTPAGKAWIERHRHPHGHISGSAPVGPYSPKPGSAGTHVPGGTP